LLYCGSTWLSSVYWFILLHWSVKSIKIQSIKLTCIFLKVQVVLKKILKSNSPPPPHLLYFSQNSFLQFCLSTAYFNENDVFIYLVSSCVYILFILVFVLLKFYLNVGGVLCIFCLMFWIFLCTWFFCSYLTKYLLSTSQELAWELALINTGGLVLEQASCPDYMYKHICRFSQAREGSHWSEASLPVRILSTWLLVFNLVWKYKWYMRNIILLEPH